jgi:hypothetical protein
MDDPSILSFKIKKKKKAVSSKARSNILNYQFLGLVVLGFMRPINSKLKAGQFYTLARTNSNLGLGFRPLIDRIQITYQIL